MKTILITGSNGFIGSNIMKQLSSQYNIIECGTKSHSRNNNQNQYIKWNLGYEDEPKTLKYQHIDIIIHAAAATPNKATPENMIRSNCLGTAQITTAAKKHNVQKVIYISGLTVVGNLHPTPITEKTPIHPSNIYQMTKASGESVILELEKDHITPIILRVPSPIGPNMPQHTILPTFIDNVLRKKPIFIQGQGKRKQNYLDIRDMNKVIEQIIQIENISGIYNIGANNIITNIHLAKLCNSTLHGSSKIIYTHIPDPEEGINWTTDDTKLRKQIGNYQKIPLQQSIIDIAKSIERQIRN